MTSSSAFRPPQVALKHKVSHCVLVGDHKQLPATVKIMSKNKRIYERCPSPLCTWVVCHIHTPLITVLGVCSSGWWMQSSLSSRSRTSTACTQRSGLSPPVAFTKTSFRTVTHLAIAKRLTMTTATKPTRPFFSTACAASRSEGAAVVVTIALPQHLCSTRKRYMAPAHCTGTTLVTSS
jgi:hypothetical protein